MKSSIIKTVLIAAALLLCASPSGAAESKPGPASETKAVSNAKTTKKSAKTAKVKLVDINSAGKAQLKTLPGVDDATAEKIIAGRPYLTKADLVTENIMSSGLFAQIKAHIYALQNKAAKAKFEKLKKEHAGR